MRIIDYTAVIIVRNDTTINYPKEFLVGAYCMEFFLLTKEQLIQEKEIIS